MATLDDLDMELTKLRQQIPEKLDEIIKGQAELHQLLDDLLRAIIRRMPELEANDETDGA